MKISRDLKGPFEIFYDHGSRFQRIKSGKLAKFREGLHATGNAKGSEEEETAPGTGTAACRPEGDYVTPMPLDSPAAATHAGVPSPVGPDEKAASGSDTSGGLTMSQVASGPSEAQAGDCDTAGSRVESRTVTVAGSMSWTKRKGSSRCMGGKDRVKVTNLSSKPLSSGQLSLFKQGIRICTGKEAERYTPSCGA